MCKQMVLVKGNNLTKRKSWTALGAFPVVTLLILMVTGVISDSGVADAQSSQWSTTTPPSLAGSNPYLNGVSCISATSCFAVGGYTDESGDSTPLVEFWNGAQWSIQSAPGFTASSALSAVSCASSSSCVAVGDSYPVGSSNDKPFVDTWNGSEWQATTIPKIHSFETLMGSDSCIKSFCTAVGGEAVAGGLTLVRKSGTWSVAPNSSPDARDFSGSLLLQPEIVHGCR